jgi:hypothetical protein
MCSEISATDSDESFLYDYANHALTTGLWDGRSVSHDQSNQFQDEVEQKIHKLFQTQDPIELERTAAHFARIGAKPENQSFLEREIQELKVFDNNVIVPASNKSYFSKLWKNHKTAILIGIAVVVVVTAVVVISVCAAGAASTAALAAGGLALSAPLDTAPDATKPLTESSQKQLPSSVDIKNPFKDASIPKLSDEFLDLQHKYDLIHQMKSKLSSTTYKNSFLAHNVSDYEQSVGPIDPETYNRFFAMPKLSDEFLELQKQRDLIISVHDSGPSGTYDTFSERALSGPYYAEYKSKPPYQPINILGSAGQSTIHYHNGIMNSYDDILEAELTLYKNLDREFAIQPHMIHGSDERQGLSTVQLGRMGYNYIEEPSKPLIISKDLKFNEPQYAFAQRKCIEYGVYKTVDYEVENLKSIAKDIIAKNDPTLKQLHVTFSNGGFIFNKALERLTPDERATIVVITLGTTKIISSDLACEVCNIMGSQDWESLMLNGGPNQIIELSLKNDESIRFIEQTNVSRYLRGHKFLQEDYQRELRERIKNVLSKKYRFY